jgi:hypothetical protein
MPNLALIKSTNLGFRYIGERGTNSYKQLGGTQDQAPLDEQGHHWEEKAFDNEVGLQASCSVVCLDAYPVARSRGGWLVLVALLVVLCLVQ